MARWLITGVTGLLGSNAALALAGNHEVIGAARSRPHAAAIEFVPVDLASASSRSGLVGRANADVVLHTAAVSSIEAAEADPELAHELNVVAAADLARQALDHGARFVHISTDAVFDGVRGHYTESDPVSPMNAYGRTKAESEEAVLDAAPDSLVARVNFYGWSPTGSRSLAEFFYNALRVGRPVFGFRDVSVSTLQVSALVHSLVGLVGVGAAGVTHVVSSEPIDKFTFGRRLANRLELDAELISPASSTDHLENARGQHLDLVTSKAERLLGRKLPTQQEGLDRLADELASGWQDRVHAFRS